MIEWKSIEVFLNHINRNDLSSIQLIAKTGHFNDLYFFKYYIFFVN